MWGLVSYLHGGDAHAHGSGTEIHEELPGEDHHEDEDHHDDEEAHTE